MSNSRFWGGESEDDEDEDEENEEKPTVSTSVSQSASKFKYESSSEEEEETVKRTVKTQKDKRFPLMEATIKLIRNAVKIDDWLAVQKEFENLDKQIEKARTVIDREGMPKFYWKNLLWLDKISKEKNVNKELRKRLHTNAAKALARVSAKAKKLTTKYDKPLKIYLQNPDKEEDVVEEKKEEEKEEKKRISKID